MKIKEQFFVVKNLTTGQFVCNVGSEKHKAAFTRLLTSAKCFPTFECAGDAIRDDPCIFYKQGSGKQLEPMMILNIT